MSPNPPLDHARALIREIPDYPAAGILFQDITPLLADALAYRACIDALIAPFRSAFDVVAGIEARGFLLAAAAAAVAEVGVIPLRKAGKLPRPAARVSYALEYGEAAVEAHRDIAPGARVLLIDDVLATGGTLAAGRTLITELGGVIAGTSVLLEIPGLGGRASYGDVHAVFRA